MELTQKETDFIKNGGNITILSSDGKTFVRLRKDSISRVIKFRELDKGRSDLLIDALIDSLIEEATFYDTTLGETHPGVLPADGGRRLSSG